MRVRTIRRDDLPAMTALVQSAGVGLTSLPSNVERLRQRIERSEAALTGEAERADAEYLFVLEDTPQQRVVGLCGIVAAVGLRSPWYHDRIGLSVHASRELGIYRRLQTLFLTNDLTGCSELCSLYLHPDYRHSQNGSLLSKSRMLFLAEYPDRFAGTVIAEMRGVSDSEGRSPFWDALGARFFRMAYSQADYLSGVGDKSFIAELMPQHPVYTAMLSAEACAAIGEVHPHTRPARAMLAGEGLRPIGYVDIFDAGPTLAAEREQIRAVRDSRILAWRPASLPGAGAKWLVSNRRPDVFRVVLAAGPPVDGVMPLSDAAIRQLGLQGGDTVRAVPLTATGDE